MCVVSSAQLNYEVQLFTQEEGEGGIVECLKGTCMSKEGEVEGRDCTNPISSSRIVFILIQSNNT